MSSINLRHLRLEVCIDALPKNVGAASRADPNFSRSSSISYSPSAAALKYLRASEIRLTVSKASMPVHAKDLSVCSVLLEHECYRPFCRAWGIGVLNGRIRNLPIPWILCCLIGKLSRQVCNILIYTCKTNLIHTFDTCCIPKVSPSPPTIPGIKKGAT